MADAFTDTTTVGTATTAYDMLANFALRPELYFNRLADKKATRQSHRGSAVTFRTYTEMAPKITTLSETVDVDAVAIADTGVTVTLNEYGNAAITSAKVRGTSYLVVSADVANLIGWNAGISFDSLARNTLIAGSVARFGGTAANRAALAAGDKLTAANVRQARTILANAHVRRLENGLYRAFIAPDVSYDLTSETGAASWRDPHTYSDPRNIWMGEVGAFEGFAFVETPRLSHENLAAGQGGPGGFTNGGAGSTVDVYPTIFAGREALAKAWSSAVSGPEPAVVLGEVTDKLKRFVPVGWYWLGGFGRFRESAMVRFETSSSLGTNT